MTSAERREQTEEGMAEAADLLVTSEALHKRLLRGADRLDEFAARLQVEVTRRLGET